MYFDVYVGFVMGDDVDLIIDEFDFEVVDVFGVDCFGVVE